MGSPTISSIVREEYKPSSEVRDSLNPIRLRKDILERLPLFLHERTHGKTKVTYEWLSAPGNFIVTEVGKLTLTRTLQFGQLKLEKSQDVYATATRKGKGPVTMWIGANTKIDHYEYVNNLFRLHND